MTTYFLGAKNVVFTLCLCLGFTACQKEDFYQKEYLTNPYKVTIPDDGSTVAGTDGGSTVGGTEGGSTGGGTDGGSREGKKNCNNIDGNAHGNNRDD